jgi:hypothetical protein
MATFAPQHIACQSQEGGSKNKIYEVTTLTCTFPITLHKMLQNAEQNDFQDIVSWNSTGTSFKVHKRREFAERIMPVYFTKQTKYKSFQRQLNLYGFSRIHHGMNKGNYCHTLFSRHNPSLSLLHVRQMPSTTKTSAVKNDIFPDALLIQSTTTLNDPTLSLERNQSISDLIDDARETEHSFPWKVHDMLQEAESNNFAHIVSWEPDGVSFRVRKSDEFVTTIMPLYFNQTKYESFRRQLNLYNFSRVARGISRGKYFHSSFVKGDRSLCKLIKRRSNP